MMGIALELLLSIVFLSVFAGHLLTMSYLIIRMKLDTRRYRKELEEMSEQGSEVIKYKLINQK
jgi:uncharacterized membrane protein YciS (DUF1049 family)